MPIRRDDTMGSQPQKEIYILGRDGNESKRCGTRKNKPSYTDTF